jgi:hypothetical protein
VAQVVAARVGCNRESGGHRKSHLRHLGETYPLPAQLLAPTRCDVLEIEDVARRSRCDRHLSLLLKLEVATGLRSDIPTSAPNAVIVQLLSVSSSTVPR